MKLKIPGQWSTNRISTAVLASVLALTSGAAALIAFKPSTSVQHLLSGGAYVVNGKSYVHVNTATGKADLRGYTTDLEGRITDIVQQDGNAVLYTSKGAIPISRRTMRTEKIIPRAQINSGFTVVETGVAPNQDFYTAKESRGWVQRESGQLTQKAGGQIKFKTKITPLIGGRDGTLVVVKPLRAEIATVFGGVRKKTISFGSSEQGAPLTAGRVDGKAVVVDPASGKIVVFKDGRVVRSVELGLTGEAKVSTDSETGELVLILDPTQGAKRLLAVDVDTGAVREVSLPPGALDNATAPPLVTPDAIYLYNKDDGPKTLVAYDSESGVKLSSDDKFKELPRDAHVEVVDGSVIVDNRGGDDAYVISGPDRIDKVEKGDIGIPEVNKNPNPPTTTTPPVKPNAGTQPSPRVVVKPGAPVLTGVPGDKSATLTWSAPDSGGGVIKGYKLECAPDCGGYGGEGIPATALGYVVSGLDNDKTYKFKVAVENDAPSDGWGPWSNEVEVDPTGDVPRPPTSVEVTDLHKGKLKVSWTPWAPSANSVVKFVVTGFNVYAGDRTAAERNQCGSTVPAGSTAIDLSPSSCWQFDSDASEALKFFVTAVGTSIGADGSSPPESAASVVTRSIDPYRAPAAPGVTVSPSAKGKVTVTVEAGVTADRPVHYELKASGVTGTGTPDRLDTLNSPGNPFTVSVPDDAPTGYTVDVTAVYNDTTLLSDNKSAPTSKTVVTPLSPTVSVRLTSNAWNSATVEVIASTGATCTDTGGRSNNCGSFTVRSTGSQNFTGDITATNIYGQTGTGNYNFTTPPHPPKVEISKGAATNGGCTNGVCACSNSSCAYIHVATSYGAGGSYTCSVDGGPVAAGRGYFTNRGGAVIYGNVGVNSSNEYFFLGYPGAIIHCTVNGVDSNQMTW